jgi:putative ABC transport system substrate-binding protein
MSVSRRDFITLLGGAVLWPDAARAQPGNRIRRIGVLSSHAADDPESPVRVAAFAQGMEQLGWSIGSNLRVEYRWSTNDAERRKYAAELVALAPDIVLAESGAIVGALQQASRTVPIVFVNVIDPVGGGWVESLAHPGGNATGFASVEFAMSAKLLELLKEIAPSVRRVAVIRDPSVPAGSGGFAAIQAVAPTFAVDITPVGVRDAGEIERGITAFARAPNGGLIVTASSSVANYHELLFSLAARHQLPAGYPNRVFVTGGGLMSYGIDAVSPFRQAAGYVDRILRGEKPADLPVQTPTKFELVINLKTAKALGLTVPPTLLAIADEVIE